VKKLLIVLAVIVGSICLYWYARPEKTKQAEVKLPEIVSPTPISQKISKNYVFVPYWTFTKNIVEDSKAALIYFGVGANEKGIEIGDQGYSKLKTFINLTPNADERILAVRMLDKNINAKIIKDPTLQEQLITDAIKIAKENNFNGILLDYETSAFGFDSTTNNITAFYKLFSERVGAQNMAFYVTLYGDTYFQSRPFDVKKIGQMADKVIIMAYDFSKSRGNPGPNFPLTDTNSYGYDFRKMIEDFQKDVDNQKMVITFGYFGYDWRVDGKGQSLTNGVPLSTNEIEKEFVDKCKYENCNVIRSAGTSEPSIKYTDESDEEHIIWFEDAISVEKKKEFLRTKGILEIASWAYSYY